MVLMDFGAARGRITHRSETAIPIDSHGPSGILYCYCLTRRELFPESISRGSERRGRDEEATSGSSPGTRGEEAANDSPRLHQHIARFCELDGRAISTSLFMAQVPGLGHFPVVGRSRADFVCYEFKCYKCGSVLAIEVENTL